MNDEQMTKLIGEILKVSGADTYGVKTVQDGTILSLGVYLNKDKRFLPRSKDNRETIEAKGSSLEDAIINLREKVRKYE